MGLGTRESTRFSDEVVVLDVEFFVVHLLICLGDGLTREDRPHEFLDVGSVPLVGLAGQNWDAFGHVWFLQGRELLV